MRLIYIALLLFTSAAAQAATWHIENLYLDRPSGAVQVTGSFDYTEAAGYSNVVIASPSWLFDALSPVTPDLDNSSATVLFGTSDFGYASMYFQQALDDAGGTVAISDYLTAMWPGAPNQCTGDNFCALGLSGGYVTTVPIPAAAWLFLSALGGLAYLKQRNS